MNILAESTKPETPKDPPADAQDDHTQETVEAAAGETETVEAPVETEEHQDLDQQEQEEASATSEDNQSDGNELLVSSSEDAEVDIQKALEETVQDGTAEDLQSTAEHAPDDAEDTLDAATEEGEVLSDDGVETADQTEPSGDTEETEEIVDAEVEEPSEDALEVSEADRESGDIAAAIGGAAAAAASTPWEPSSSVEREAAQPERGAVPAASAPQPAPTQRRGGFFPMLLGGAIAAVLGFLAGRGDLIDPYLPEGLRQQTVDTAPLEEQLTERAEAQSALEGRLDEVAATVSGLQTEFESGAVPAIQTELSALSDAVAGVQENTSAGPDKATRARIDELVAAVASLQLTASGDPDAAAGTSEITAAIDVLATRLDAVETLAADETPPPDMASTEDLDSLEAAQDAQGEALAALRAEVNDLTQEARLADETARGEAQKVLARAALTQVATAVDSGSPYAAALSDLQEITPIEVPEALSVAAEEGVVTLAELHAGYPDAARAALAAARADVPETDVEGIGGFLRRQLSVRSVVPREGDSPDAVLSRAEAAVNSGDLETAFTELGVLPDAARAAMQEWLTSAEARFAVQEAAAGLATSLASN